MAGRLNIFGNLYFVLSFINIMFAFAVIFLERRNIGVTWAWLMVLLFLPGIGFVAYLLFGQNLSKRKIYKAQEAQLHNMALLVEKQIEAVARRRIEYHDPVMADYHDMIYMNLQNGYAFFTQDNRIDIFTEGNRKFDSLFETIAGAKHHIHLMYYIVRDDGLGRRLIAALSDKAKEGVEVRFLYDDIGCARLSKHFFKPLLAAGGQASAFFPSRIPYVNMRLNFRNHRKLAIIDGTCGYIGGFNVGDEYLGLDSRFGPWRDTHLRIEGSSVLQMQAQFIMDWNLASRIKLNPIEEYFPLPPHEGDAGVQILSSGPNNDREQIKNAYIKVINSAKESVYLQTPYFIPDESLLNAIKMAALSGVDIKIMLPAVPDHKIVYWASFSYLGDLLDVGVKCYLYHRGFIHAKTIVADGKVGSVGTANIDIRSFKLNFEVNALIYGGNTASKLKKIFEHDLKHCTELTLERYYSRPRFHRARESVTRLLSPIL